MSPAGTGGLWRQLGLCGQGPQPFADATGEVNKGRASVGVKRKTRDAKVKALRKRVRGVVEDMKETMPEDDPNWQAFGFIPPSSEPAPGAVEEVEFSFLPEGQQLITWPPVARTVRYRGGAIFLSVNLAGSN